MVMRVTQALLFQSSKAGLQRQFQEIRSSQEQSLSGRSVNRPSDSPASQFRDLVAGSELAGVKSLKRSADFTAQRTDLAEQHIQVIHDQFLDMQELASQLGSAQNYAVPQIFTAASQRAQAAYEEILQRANQEMDGVSLFGGGRQAQPFSTDNVAATAIRMRQQGRGGMVATSGLNVDVSVATAAVPASVKITYHSPTSIDVFIDGERQTPVENGEGTWDIGRGITLTLPRPSEKPEDGGAFTDGDQFFFEIVPAYKGGVADRTLQIAGGQEFAGNITGAELIEGKGPLGRNVNLFGVAAGLRGALLRQDGDEVNAWLGQILEGASQASDLQVVTGVRTAQMEAMRDSLDADQLALEEYKATNVNVDVFEVFSRMEQATQAMQYMTATERQVLNTSLLDFLK
ncbi:MAG: hypothetical protein HQL60_01535 [Magnetococcales bacterium]|nr:hypothetical protein [Magnetococcales bacterium]